MPVAEAIGLRRRRRLSRGAWMEAVWEHSRDVVGYAVDRLAEVPGPRSTVRPTWRHRNALNGTQAAGASSPRSCCDRRARAPTHHCAQPPMRRLGVPASSRNLSFAGHSTREDVDRLVEGARRVRGCSRLGANRWTTSTASRSSSTTSCRRNWSPPLGTSGPDLEIEDDNPLCGEELKVHDGRSAATGASTDRAVLRPRVRDLAGVGVAGLRRGDRHGPVRPAPARPLVGARPAGHRHRPTRMKCALLLPRA